MKRPLALPLVLIALVLAGAAPAAARPLQSVAEPVLRVASVSPWVAPDGEFQVRFGPSVAAPPDAQLTVTIHQSLDASDDPRGDLEEIIDGGSAGRILQAPVTRPLSELGDPATGTVLTIPIRSNSGDSDRVFLPNPGIHPVELVLTQPNGPELWREVVFLNRLPVTGRNGDDGPGARPVRVTLLLPVESGPAITSEGRAEFGVEEQAALASVDSLLTSVPTAPLTLGVRPNTLDGLARSTAPWAADLLAALSTPDQPSVVSLMPYTAVDTGGLVDADAAAVLSGQILIGAATVDARIRRTPVATTWAFDETVTNSALRRLANTGVQTLLVPSSSLDVEDDGSAFDAMTSPVTLEDGSGIRALAYDTSVSQRLATTGVDPALRSHQAVSLMLSTWFAAGELTSPPPLASAILLSPTTDAEVLESLTATLSSGGPLLADPRVGPLPASNPRRNEPMATLAERIPPDQRPAVDAAASGRARIDSYASMTGLADPDLELWNQLTSQSLAAEVDDAERAAWLASVGADIDARISRIETPRERRVVVTSRDTVIPLRFRNDLPFDVRLVMRARSPRLDISPEDATTEIVLLPGENRVDLPVTVQAPGESLLRIDLSSPDGDLRLPSSDVPIRSTAISGVGAALSVLSILVLIGWWFRTVRRGRREHARDGGTHPSAETPTDEVPAGRLGGGG